MAAPRFGSCSAVVNNDVPFYEEGIPYYARPPGFTQPRIFSAYEPTINTCGILPSRPLSPLPSARDPYTQLVRSPSAPNHVHTAAAAADMRHACHATDYESGPQMLSPFETSDWYCKGYFKPDACLHEERSLAGREAQTPPKANVALYHTKEPPPDEWQDLFPQSLWKLKVAQHERALSTRGLRFPGYPPSKLNPEWEKYYADKENGGTTLT